MPTDETPVPTRNYGCQEVGCERQFDYIVMEAREGESMWFCMPHYLAFSVAMLETATEKAAER